MSSIDKALSTMEKEISIGVCFFIPERNRDLKRKRVINRLSIGKKEALRTDSGSVWLIGQLFLKGTAKILSKIRNRIEIIHGKTNDKIYIFAHFKISKQMKDLIAKFSTQMKEAIVIGEAAKLTPSEFLIKNVLITGLGGSGIGGTIVSEIASTQCPVPVIVNKDYFLPEFVNEETLVIVSSYSGNTEETLCAMEIAMKRGAKLVCITSGGRILELAQDHAIDHIIVPGGMPPRSCLGYSFTQLLYVFNFFCLINEGFKADLQKAIALLDAEETNIQNKAMAIAKKLVNKIPIIYSVANNEGVAIRLRQQINENSKMLCWHHVIPEMNHNELVGWTQESDLWAVVILRSNNDYERTQKRIEINKEVIQKYTDNITEIYSMGESIIERSVYMIHLGDWISWYLSELRQVDATEVNVINYLKNTLAGS